ncbi:branched-chain amino acid ABC transporter permease [Marinospirillum alkaliphilum]|uniref:Amino acid/amide ABC transporter membrane protein 2, HAAT family (TC 3.A.1.4.-) n=1 Tax=Marinospirillum alkaliphilum DSM 21637 TaxID=1122209 RepID=A0A1K1TG90_9GAMM|nr:branched-chain amino acid ABC transporter permease [Marinospirillum alkaliphilum]SFW99719.1 amino acid/amide ABC transporter membrane protein 2, HAAT family (TC 3.A.1.4.-) [Marinospirillum alkaliphilum DSM 21637]
MKQQELIRLVLVALVFGLLALLPLIPANDRLMALAVPIAMYAVLATSWSLFSGPTHYISLATAAFYGVGAYTLANGLEVFSYPLLLLMAALLGGGLAALVGMTTLRLSGVYFVIFTLGLAELIRQLVTWYQNNFTGSRGSYVFTDITEAQIYWQLLGLLALVFLLGWLINRSRLGFAIRIIGNDELVARHSGINTARTKVLLFILSGAFAAVVGAVMAPRFVYVEPSMAFSPQLSFMVVVMALLGGVHRLWGPLLGVVPFAIVWELIAANFPGQTVLFMGLAFLVVVYFIPQGVAGVLEQQLHKIRQRRGG